MLRRTALSLAALTALGACLPEPYPALEPAPKPDYTGLVVAARDGHIAGTVGDVSLDAPATRVGVWDDGDFTAVETVAQLADSAVMMLVSANGVRFVPGTDETYTFGEGPADRVGLLGCVGQEVDVYDRYDSPAESVRLVVEPTSEPTDVAVTVTGTWYVAHDGAETEIRTAEASFVLERE